MTPEQEESQQTLKRKLKTIDESFMRLEIFGEFLGGTLRNIRRTQKEIREIFKEIEKLRRAS